MAYRKAFTDDWTKKHYPRIMLRSARKEMNLSIRELAKRANWSRSYIGEAEKGTCAMSVRMAQDLARVLMVNNWWDLIEQFRYEEKKGVCKFIGNCGTIIEIRTTQEKDKLLNE